MRRAVKDLSKWHEYYVPWYRRVYVQGHVVWREKVWRRINSNWAGDWTEYRLWENDPRWMDT